MTDEAKRIKEARLPRDLFGLLTGSMSEQLEALRGIFARLSLQVHPDKWQVPEAAEVFDRLRILYVAGQRLIREGDYATGMAGIDQPIGFSTKLGRYRLDARPVYRGDSSGYYGGTLEDKTVLVKVARSPRDNDLVANEVKVLRAVIDATPEDQRAYLPSLIEGFALKGKPVRQAASFRWADLGLIDLRRVGEAYPAGVDPRDMAWMFRRLLHVLAFAHDAGYVHGAVLPEHVLIEPTVHGLRLIDWKYAVKVGETMKSIPSGRRDFYPPEVLAKKPATTAVDVWTAIGTMRSILGPSESLPPRLRSFFRGCRLENPTARPSNPRMLLREFDDLLERMYGPRKFRAFAVPATTTTQAR